MYAEKKRHLPSLSLPNSILCITNCTLFSQIFVRLSAVQHPSSAELHLQPNPKTWHSSFLSLSPGWLWCLPSDREQWCILSCHHLTTAQMIVLTLVLWLCIFSSRNGFKAVLYGPAFGGSPPHTPALLLWCSATSSLTYFRYNKFENCSSIGWDTTLHGIESPCVLTPAFLTSLPFMSSISLLSHSTTLNFFRYSLDMP